MLTEPRSPPIKIMVTAAGGASAINCIKSLKKQHEIEFRVVSVDSSQYSAGFYLSDSHYMVPKATSKHFMDAILEIVGKEKVDVILPTHSLEIPVFAKMQDILKGCGISILVSSVNAVEIVNDKWRTYLLCLENSIPILKSWRATTINNSKGLLFPIYAKPIVGSGSKNHLTLKNTTEHDHFLKHSNSSDYIFQELVEDAQEFTVDVLADKDSNIRALLARERVKIKDGLAVVTRSVAYEPFLNSIQVIANKLKLVGGFNAQFFKTNAAAVQLIEINPRFAAGGLPLATYLGINMPLLYAKLALDIPVNNYNYVYSRGVIMIKHYEELFLTE